MKRMTLFTLGIVFLLTLPQFVSASQKGKDLLQTNNCLACHTVGNGRLVGPDLKGLHKRRTPEWVVSFVQSSTQLIASGDVDAIKIFEEFNKMPMPDHSLAAADIKEMLVYIQSLDAAADTQVKTEPAVKVEYTQADMDLGAELFNGRKRFENKGTSCIACHSVKNDKMISGGSYAKDLTNSYATLQDSGVKAILSSPPFPAMQQAYKKHTLTESEIKSLIAFLKHIDQEKFYNTGCSYSRLMLGVGGVGVFVLLGVFGVVWVGRKKYSVNRK